MKISPYLTEKNLKDVLSYIFNTEIKPQARIKYEDMTLIIDYSLVLPHNQQLMFVEFNGPRHYTQTKTIMRDYFLKSYCFKNNIRLVEIPYFVQLTNYNIPQYFGTDVEEYYLNKNNLIVETDQLSGFLEKRIILPYDYCLFGVQRFCDDMMPVSHVLNGPDQDSNAEFWGTSKEIFTTLWENRSHKEIMCLQMLLDEISNDKTIEENFAMVLTHYPT